MGAILQNYSTSPWVTDEYVDLPFWPRNLSSAVSPWNYRSPLPEFCIELPLKAKDFGFQNESETQGLFNNYLATMLCESEGGCQFTLSDQYRLVVANKVGSDPIVTHNDKCPYDNTILMSTPWWTNLEGPDTEFLSNMTIKAYGCESVHNMAEMSVLAESTTTGLSIQFDKEEFKRVCYPVISPQYGLSNDSETIVSGAAALLGTGYNFEVLSMMADSNLPITAAQLRRQFFNEVLKTSLQYPGASSQKHDFGTRTVPSRRVLVNQQVAWALFTLLVVSFCLLLALLRSALPSIRPLGVYQDPSTLLTLHRWASHDSNTLSIFRSLDLSTRRILKNHIGDCTFRTTPRGLEQADQADHNEYNSSPQELSLEDRARILPGLRLRSLIALIIYTLLSLVASTTLFGLAQSSCLHQSFFTYRAHVNGFGNIDTISPFAIIPTAPAITLGLWWKAVDTTLRILQPFIGMSEKAKKPSKSLVLSYASQFWMTLKLRRFPFVEEMTVGFDNDSVLSQAILGLETDWMYTAIIQTALNGPQPAWSKDDWSLSRWSKHPITQCLVSPANVTIQTPAIRARIECTAIEQVKNVSFWFEHDRMFLMENGTKYDDFFWPKLFFSDGNLTTDFSTQGGYPSCCLSSTGDPEGKPSNASSALVYRTEKLLKSEANWGPRHTLANSLTNSNFTIKWLRGPAGLERQLRFVNPPDAQALNCTPVIETSEARVSVDYARGLVQDYEILQPPLVENVAWSDPFNYRNISETPEWVVKLVGTYRNVTRLKTKPFNTKVTTSYGVFFLRALLRAACLDRLDSIQLLEYHEEDNDRIEDKVFNMRDNTAGMNFDFMSYATYAQTGYNPDAMLDPHILLKTSQRVFSTFFQHFVNNRIFHETEANPPMNGMPIPLTPYRTKAPQFQDVASRVTDRIATAAINTRVDVLRINPVVF
ncbi:hypothetical protein T440DRAFT_493304 [Plenodomus tracheiphilus IPT5]|uniref:Uncharacterized protein n=1 Tax=Plenodomus tracheiphilus IPT5 TaxID=1408161 RepID=A0A6A7ATQ0_9PLEO|nr:hypothetical protein T440DRAFT_493304 [Plenodomus tracheiphilus IPT5]